MRGLGDLGTRGLRTVVIGVLAAGAYVYTQLWSEHYTPGTARIDAYATTDKPMELKVFFATGWQDIVEEPSVTEDARAVAITIPTRVLVPCRGCFKQASATLLETTVTLRAPLGQRVVINGATRAEVPPVRSN